MTSDSVSVHCDAGVQLCSLLHCAKPQVFVALATCTWCTAARTICPREGQLSGPAPTSAKDNIEERPPLHRCVPAMQQAIP